MKQKRWVSNNIGLRPELLVPRSAKEVLPKWLPKNTLLTSCARHAIYQGCKALGLKKGDGVLAPGFICNTVTLPMEKAGLRIHTFNLNKDLSIDWEDLLKNLKKGPKIKALVWYHYLGIPIEFEKVRQFCKQHNLLFIEDCAHGLFTQINGKPCGQGGDIAVFSIFKMIPVLHAGALVINNPKYRLKNKPKALDLSQDYLDNLSHIELYRHQLYMQSQNSSSQVLRMGYKSFAKIAMKNQTQYDQIFKIDEVSRTVMLNVDPQKVRQTRANNFKFYLKHFKDISVFKVLPNGACPLSFPIWTKERDALRKRIEAKGVEGLTYWPDYLLPKGAMKKHPNSKWLADSILSIPSHQDLGIDELNYVSQTLKECL